MSTDENKAIARGYIEAFVRNDLAALDRSVAADHARHDPGLPFQVRGPEGVKQLSSAIRAGFPDLQATVEDAVAEGDKVLLRMTMRGTHRGEFMGIAPTGRTVTFGVMDLFRIEGGQIAEVWAAVDNLGLLQQLGVVPGPGQPA